MPYGYRVQAIHGFVEELVVNDDPEYQWIDKIRSQRASNEARQILFSKLSGWSISFDRKVMFWILALLSVSCLGGPLCSPWYLTLMDKTNTFMFCFSLMNV